MLVAVALWAALHLAPQESGKDAGVTATPRPRACRLTGAVIDTQTRAGVAGAVITLKTAAAQRTRTVETGPDGRFEFLQIDPGQYTVAAAAAGFAESAPAAVALGGSPCAATIEIPYRLAVTTEARPDAARPPEATAIPGAVSPVLTGNAITTAPGGLDDVFRAMQAQPGVSASQDNRNDLLVRGGGAIENQIRIDGFDVPNLTHFGAQGGSGGALAILPPWLIQTGTLDVSGFSAAFGDRMSSVAHIALRDGRTDRTHAMLGGGVGGAMGTVEGAVGQNGSWLASARRSLLEMAFREKNREAVPTFTDVLLKVSQRLNDRHALTLLAIGARDGVHIEDPKTREDDVTGDERMAIAGVRIDSQWSNRTTTAVAVSGSVSQVDATSYDGADIDAIDRGRDVEFRVRADLRRAATAVGDLLVGVAVKAYHYDYDLYVTDLWTPYELAKRDLRSSDRRSSADAAAYVELDRGFFRRRVRLLAGVRGDRWGAAGVSAASPRLKVEYAPTPRARLSGYWGLYRQGVPSIWMASAPQNVGMPPIASRQVGGGADVAIASWLHAGAEAFDKRYHNYPVDPVAPSRVMVSAAADFESPFVGPLVSAGRVQARGIDGVIVATPAPPFQVTANYSYWTVRQHGLDGVWRPAENELTHQGRVEFLWKPASGWSTGLRWRHVTGRPYTPFDVKASTKAGRGVYDFKRINALDYPAYDRLDVRVDRTFVRGRAATMIYAEVDNALGRRNILTYEWSHSLKAPKTLFQWGRMFVGGIRVEF
jgi:hypothetical protein